MEIFAWFDNAYQSIFPQLLDMLMNTKDEDLIEKIHQDRL